MLDSLLLQIKNQIYETDLKQHIKYTIFSLGPIKLIIIFSYPANLKLIRQ